MSEQPQSTLVSMTCCRNTHFGALQLLKFTIFYTILCKSVLPGKKIHLPFKVQCFICHYTTKKVQIRWMFGSEQLHLYAPQLQVYLTIVFLEVGEIGEPRNIHTHTGRTYKVHTERPCSAQELNSEPSRCEDKAVTTLPLCHQGKMRFNI